MTNNECTDKILNSAELMNQLHNAMEIAHLGMWEWDIEADLLCLSEETYKIVGIDKDIFDHKMSTVFNEIIHPDSKDDFIESMNLSKSGDYIPDRAYKIKNKEKSERWIKIKSRVLYKNEKPYKLLGVLMDITDDVLSKKTLEQNISFINTLIENLPHPIYYKDKKGFYRYFNKHFEGFLGLKNEEIMNKSVYDVAEKKLADIYKKADDDLMNSGGLQVYESKVKYADGSLRDVLFTKSAHVDSNGNVMGLIGLMQDITEEKKMRKEIAILYEAKEIFIKFNQTMMDYDNEKAYLHDILTRFQDLIEETDFSVLLEVGEDGVIYLYDSVGAKLLNNEMKMLFEDSFIYYVFQGNYIKPCIVENFDPSKFSEDDPGKDIIKINNMKSSVFIPILVDSKIRWFFIYGSKIENAYSKNKTVFDYIKDEMDIIIKIFRLYQTTLQLSRFDFMSGMMNRRYFENITKVDILEKTEDFHIVIIDMDGLKEINDSIGHQKGDYYIRLLTSMINQRFDGGDGYFGRIGGDEFAGVIRGMTLDNLKNILENLRYKYIDIIKASTKLKKGYGFSYGIATKGNDGKTYEELIKIADMRMYEYKKNNKI